MSLPGVSWLCPTFARPPHYQHLLEERVESFLRQDYAGPRELLILNDCVAQDIVLPGPEDSRASCMPFMERRWGNIRIVRCDFRFDTLGDKYNAMVKLARHDLLMPAEDDDIHLPWAMTQAVQMLGMSGNNWFWDDKAQRWDAFVDGDYWKPPQVIFLPKGSPPIFKHSVGVRHHASIFTRTAWQKVGGYPAVTGSQDAAFDSLLRQRCRVAPEGDLPPSEWGYIYRWSVSPNHLSGTRDMVGLWNQQKGEAGRFVLRPHWREDYVALVRDAFPAPAPGLPVGGLTPCGAMGGDGWTTRS